MNSRRFFCSFRIACLSLVLLILAACGQKGDLYLPGNAQIAARHLDYFV